MLFQRSGGSRAPAASTSAVRLLLQRGRRRTAAARPRASTSNAGCRRQHDRWKARDLPHHRCARIRRHHAAGGLSPVPGTAGARQVHPALVRRQRRDLAGVHAVLPGGAAGGLCVCLRADAALSDPAAGAVAGRHPGREPGSAADRALRRLEADRRQRSDVAHPRHAHGVRRPALHCARHDHTAAVALARAYRADARSGALLRGLQHRLLPGAAFLPVPVRAPARERRSDALVVVGLRVLRRDVRGLRLAHAGTCPGR